MRYGLIASIIFHVVVLGLIIFNFTGSENKDGPPPLPVAVEVMSPKDHSERQAGRLEGKAESPAPPAEVKAPEAPASAKKEVEQKPSPKPAEKELLAPPPPKAAEALEPKPMETARAEPSPQKPPEKPKPVVKKESPPKPAPKPKVAEAKKAEELEAKRVQTKPASEYTFDPNRIEAILHKDSAPAQRAQISQPPADAQPSRLYSDRQTALLNRDPNAGAPSGDYNPNQPWRPASSLQDQAMGLPQAHGAMNAGSCADLVQSRIEQNWYVPRGLASAENTIVRLHIELNRDGTLAKPPAVMEEAASPAYRAMSEAAISAAYRGQPYVIPPEQYERCRDMVLRFNPREMYGG
ncbi:MAG TPA: cell envelope integrity protein TolA [Hyphomicrobiales bacterium]|nr:cell envelope integrity protein TolA [Hyphomicrobiales bacterium]